MRWSLVLCGLLLAACAQLQPVPPPTALPGPLPTGQATAATEVAGEVWEPCARRQLKPYPPVLAKPSSAYYSGPWCQIGETGSRFMWMYARPMTVQQTPERIREYVNQDAGQMVRELKATGYQTIEQADKDLDIYYMARRPTSPNVVIVSVLGQNPPPAGQSFSGTDPLRLTVEVRRAGPEDTPSPSP